MKDSPRPAKRRRYDAAFRAEALRLASESRSTYAAARALSINAKLLYKWQKDALTPVAATRGADLDPATAAELVVSYKNTLPQSGCGGWTAILDNYEHESKLYYQSNASHQIGGAYRQFMGQQETRWLVGVVHHSYFVLIKALQASLRVGTLAFDGLPIQRGKAKRRHLASPVASLAYDSSKRCHAHAPQPIHET